MCRAWKESTGCEKNFDTEKSEFEPVNQGSQQAKFIVNCNRVSMDCSFSFQIKSLFKLHDLELFSYLENSELNNIKRDQTKFAS